MHVCLHLFISTIPLGSATSFRPLLHSDVFSFALVKLVSCIRHLMGPYVTIIKWFEPSAIR